MTANAAIKIARIIYPQFSMFENCTTKLPVTIRMVMELMIQMHLKMFPRNLTEYISIRAWHMDNDIYLLQIPTPAFQILSFGQYLILMHYVRISFVFDAFALEYGKYLPIMKINSLSFYHLSPDMPHILCLKGYSLII